MINNELHAHVRKEVTNQVTPRKSELKQPIDPARKKFFLGIMCQPSEKETLSDYDHSITKSYEKKGNRRPNIPKLGEQPQRSIPPLKVLSKEYAATTDFMVETKLTKVHIPIHPGAGIKEFVLTSSCFRCYNVPAWQAV